MKQILKTYNSDSKEKLSDDTEWLSQDVDQHFEECQIFTKYNQETTGLKLNWTVSSKPNLFQTQLNIITLSIPEVIMSKTDESSYKDVGFFQQWGFFGHRNNL